MADLFFRKPGLYPPLRRLEELADMGVLGVVMQKYMVIERFKARCRDAAHERFHRQGRLLPNGLYYLNSWLH